MNQASRKDRRSTLTAEYNAFDSMSPTLRAFIRRQPINFTAQQIIEIAEYERKLGAERVVKWLEGLLDQQYPQWREWK